MRTTTFSLLCILSGAHAFAPSQTTSSFRRTATCISSTPEASSPVASEPVAPTPEASAPVASTSEASAPVASSSAASSTPSPGNKNKPTWEVKQHLYGLDMMKEAGGTVSVTLDADGKVAGGEALPLPPKYITCGKCKSLFAISDEDLGDKGKGCRVKCSVCNNSWFQSRERLFDIPTESHTMSPATKSELGRIARNLSRDIPPSFMGVFKLYVGNLDWRTTSDELLDFFETYSKKEDGEKISVCDVSIVMGPDGRSRGFAFVSFYDEVDGRAALACNGLECNDRELAVREPNN